MPTKLQPVPFAHFIVPLTLAMLLLSACRKSASEAETTRETQPAAVADPMFTLLPPEKTGISFTNTLTEGLNTNVLIYQYFYNGGGVAAGDLNNDGLQDLYFTANMGSNRLYLNKGEMQFADITTQSGAAGREGPWKTGVTMADVNGDGLLDIYVSYSGKMSPEKRTNQLFINQGADGGGVPHFVEQAARYGLASPATNTQTYFFDYDRDNDLDALLLNHNPQSLPVLDDAATEALLSKPDSSNGVRLLRNDRNYFRDVTEKAGISSSALTYGLGAGIADLNGDGWTDIYLSNDYTVPDYLYINNRNGTFSDRIQSGMGHISHSSMGNEVADLNNDGLPDVLTLDMLPEDNHRQKMLLAPDNYERFNLNIRTGFYYQYMRNMLQVNNGDGTFSEVGQLAGISNTDWSWAPLAADYDNDGWKDLYITNGFLRDYTNMDFLKYMNDFLGNRQVMRNDLLQLVDKIPSSNVINYIYKNTGGITFTKANSQWGMTRPSNSNGAAYADLDNDGDLDLIVNNVNQPAFLYRNQADKQLNHHYLRVQLRGAGQNTQGLGARVWAYAGSGQQFLEQMPARGYQSSVSPVLHFGLGEHRVVDSLRVVWPNGRQQVLRQVSADTLLTLEEKEAKGLYRAGSSTPPLFWKVASPLPFVHRQSAVNDFKRQPLLINPLSFPGPCLAKGDVNGDGREDVFTGSGAGQAGALYVQGAGGQFMAKASPALEADKGSADTDALFFDANGDTFPDLYVCSGGYHTYLPNDSLLQDRLYLNDGKGNFTRSTGALPVMRESKSCVRASDVNGDGHPDLFVGGRAIPGRYPEPPSSFLLINDGKGHFRDQTASLAPMLQKIGMVTDAAWADLDGDKRSELVITGEWMPITVLGNTHDKFTDQTGTYFAKPYRGWWNKLLVDDLNGDGQADLVVGNQGLNTQCKATDQEPAELYYKDFDDNGSIDPILCFYIGGKSYPYLTRDELLDQISLMRTRFPDYKSYADATLKDIFTPEELKGVARLSVNCLSTVYFERTPGGKFSEKALPLAAQYSPVFAITALDYNQDGNKDLLLCGNINQARLRFGKYDANYGLLLRGGGQGKFEAVPQMQSGFHLNGDVRSVMPMGSALLFGINGRRLEAYQLRTAGKKATASGKNTPPNTAPVVQAGPIPK